MKSNSARTQIFKTGSDWYVIYSDDEVDMCSKRYSSLQRARREQLKISAISGATALDDVIDCNEED